MGWLSSGQLVLGAWTPLANNPADSSPNPGGGGLLAEDGDFLITEGGDFIVTE